MSNTTGTLYIVATPIGNLGDMSQRAIEVLRQVGVIAAEDTRHSRPLLQHFGIATSCIPLHEHNEREQSVALISRLRDGENVALISDAGTPLLSDPGFHLVREARTSGIQVVPVPGASALLAALSVAGLPTDRFVFEGFLPSKSFARRQHLERLQQDSRTLVFYEAPHRILETLADMVEIFGGGREVVMARELTKHFETLRGGELSELLEWAKSDPNQQRGEIVLVVGGARPGSVVLDEEAVRVLKILLQEMPVKQAAALAAQITGQKKNHLYQYAIKNLAAAD